MAEQTNRRFRSTLATEIAQWRQDGVVAPEVAEKLTAMYPVPAYDSKLITISLIVGSMLIGLASLLFIGSNWDQINRVVKIALFLGAMLSSYIAAWYCSYEPGNSPKLGSAFLLLGALLFGGTIWMIEQFLNTDCNLTTGLVYWAIGTAAATFVSRSQITCCLLALQLVALQLYSADIFSYGQNSLISLVYFIPAFVAAVLLAARVRSRVALYLLLAGGTGLIGMGTGTRWVGFVAFSSIMCSTYFLLRDKWEWFAEPFLYIGTAGALIGTLIMSMDSSNEPIKSFLNLVILLGVAGVPCLYLSIARKSNRAGVIWSFSFAILLSACAYFFSSNAWGHSFASNETLKTVCSSLAFFTMVVALVVAGVKLEKILLTYGALAFAALEISVRYFGFQIDSMLMRSMIFAGVGAILLCIGAIAERKRRRFLIQSPS